MPKFDITCVISQNSRMKKMFIYCFSICINVYQTRFVPCPGSLFSFLALIFLSIQLLQSFKIVFSPLMEKTQCAILLFNQDRCTIFFRIFREFTDRRKQKSIKTRDYRLFLLNCLKRFAMHFI